MLFNSNLFLFGFLPAALTGFFLAKRYMGPRAAQVWLVLTSFAFYAAAGWQLLPPLVVSILLNFMIGRTLSRHSAQGKPTQLLLAAGICADLVLLGVFKYANFFTANLHAIGLPVSPAGIALPLGISFYTFTQIAFLADAAAGKAQEYDLTRYALFVTFFPHLIAGPIIHHGEMMPQFAPARLADRKIDLLPQALMLFAIGLAKKVLLADSFANLARPIFDGAAGSSPDLIASWGAMMSYTFQIYFDFSGYSDMALGLALMFGIRLPVNFLSPYRATSVIEFWRCWHMTLSRFLRDYLYFPLGGNRKGKPRRYVNLMAVMTIGGFWHGAGWTFILWGALHGFYLLVNHAWRSVAARVLNSPPAGVWPGRVLTFLCVAFAWVLFRSENLHVAGSMYAGLLGLNGIAVPIHLLSLFDIHQAIHLHAFTIVPLYSEQSVPWEFIAMSAFGMLVVWTLPNSMQICGFAPAPATLSMLKFEVLPRHAVATALILFLCVSAINSGAVSEFVYYRF